MYEVSEEVRQRIENNCTYHPPNESQQERYPKIREKAKEFQLLICELTPPSPAQDEALKHVDLATFLANASIARYE